MVKKILRVGIMSNTYAPEKNGESVAVQALERELKKKGVQVYLAVPKVEGVYYPSHILPMKATPVAKWMSSDLHLPHGYIQDVITFFKENKIDILHTHNTLMGGMEGAYIAMKLDIPCVHTFHTDIQAYDYWDIIPGSKQACKAVIKIILNNYDHVIALSSKMHKYLLLQGVQTPIFRSHNVPMLDAITKHTKPDTELSRNLGINLKTDFVVLTHGRVAKEKGTNTGIKIMAEVIKKYPNVKYLIAGSGVESYIEEMKTLAKTLGIEKNVVFSGGYSADNLGNLASLARIYLNTSVTENHPTTPLEAMYLGLPGVYIDDMAFDYIVQDGVNGFVGNKEVLSQYIQLLISDSAMHAQMKKAAIQSANDYCKHDYTQEHIQLYTYIIEKFQQDEIDQKNDQAKKAEKFKKFFNLSFPLS